MIDDGVQTTIEALKRAMQAAGTDAEDLSAILLIGGSSRIPLVAQLLSAEFNRPIAIDADPKASISLGAAFSAAAMLAPAAAGAQTAPLNVAPHVALLGDSVFDNGAYVAGGDAKVIGRRGPIQRAAAIPV